ncbi:MAG: hypothetical protein ACXU7Z_08105 [Burkholderiaceae bacterium]
MIVFLGMTILVATALIAPGWLWAKKQYPQSVWLFALPLGGIIFWVILTSLRIGTQSLANLIEVYGVAFAAVIAVYLKLFVFDRNQTLRARGGMAALIIVMAVTLGFRLFMPLLPE